MARSQIGFEFLHKPFPEPYLQPLAYVRLSREDKKRSWAQAALPMYTFDYS
jgi:hypothetical protein